MESMSSDSAKIMGLSTRCVHAGARPGPNSPGLIPRIDRSTTFVQSPETHALTDAGRWEEALVYSRYANPTVAAVEQRIAVLEGAHGSLLFGSGQAAMAAALFACLEPGATVAGAQELYGGTVDLLESLEGQGHGCLRFAVSSAQELDQALSSGARLVVCESLSNPVTMVADLPRIAEQVHAAGGLLLVDATFATPALQRPLEHGADLVMHSATKALAGHSDVTAGVVSAARSELMSKIWTWRKRLGGILDPGAAYLLDRGMRTLALRVRAQCEGASALAKALAERPEVRAVHHPSCANHPQHALAARLLDGPGSVLSFELAAGDDALRDYVARLELASDAPSLGGVETLVSLPRFMSHAGLDDGALRAAGIEAGMVRVAVGIEDPEDLVADFLGALG